MHLLLVLWYFIKNNCALLLLPFITLIISACSTFKPSQLDYSTINVDDKKVMEYGVYTPPNWTPNESLPLVLLLHGGGGSHTHFEKFKTHEYFDQQINTGKIPRVILFTPNGKNGFWENWYDGTNNYRDWVLDKVMPEVRKKYNTLPCPDHCHLTGISMGGFGALRFAYFAPDTFSSVSAISAPILNSEENEQAKKSILVRLLFPLSRIFGPNFSENYEDEKIEKVWVNNTDLEKIRLQLVVGDNDNKQIIKGNKRFHNVLLTNDRPHDYLVYSGGHKWKYWIPNFDKVVNFLVQDPGS